MKESEIKEMEPLWMTRTGRAGRLPPHQKVSDKWEMHQKKQLPAKSRSSWTVMEQQNGLIGRNGPFRNGARCENGRNKPKTPRIAIKTGKIKLQEMEMDEEKLN